LPSSKLSYGSDPLRSATPLSEVTRPPFAGMVCVRTSLGPGTVITRKARAPSESTVTIISPIRAGVRYRLDPERIIAAPMRIAPATATDVVESLGDLVAWRWQSGVQSLARTVHLSRSARTARIAKAGACDPTDQARKIDPWEAVHLDRALRPCAAARIPIATVLDLPCQAGHPSRTTATGFQPLLSRSATWQSPRMPGAGRWPGRRPMDKPSTQGRSLPRPARSPSADRRCRQHRHCKCRSSEDQNGDRSHAPSQQACLRRSKRDIAQACRQD
jgi:hypothetical protein